MLDLLLAYLHNYFFKAGDIKNGTFTISNGVLSPSDFVVPADRYIRIVGSAVNDGVYKGTQNIKAADGTKSDEEFNGSVWLLSIPRAVLELNDEIDKWIADNAKSGAAGFTSESFGGYSYTKGTGENGAAITWQEAFATRLTPWRKL